jgi:hypothetical protein
MVRNGLIDSTQGEALTQDSFTLLHELVRQAPEEDVWDDDNYQAWRRLIEDASNSTVWSG